MANQRSVWSVDDIPDQTGRVAVITGGAAGIGLETARALANRGATVVLACRDSAKGQDAAQRLASASHVDADRAQVVSLDLASLLSVRTAVDEIATRFSHVDLLINNAGVMAIPFQLSTDGIELTFATNHVGHFALTGLLLDRLTATRGSRIVTVSSNAHRRGTADFSELSSSSTYRPGAAYDRSKLANLLFTLELQRRLGASDAATIAVAAHPGNARTSMWRTSSRLERALLTPALRPVTGWLAQSAERAALPILRAAVDPAALGGDYYGPGGPFEYTGAPVRVEPSESARDLDAQQRLWRLSEELTGVDILGV